MTDNGVKLVAKFEGLPKKDPLAAYWDAYGKVWTIGYGATYYPDGSKVKQGDRLTSIDEALSLLKTMLVKYEESVKKCVGDDIYNQLSENQKDALTSFTYNVGAGNLKSSTLLKRVKANINDPQIRDAFMMWNKSGGKELAGLTKRRSEEAAYYFNTSPVEVSNESSHSMVVQSTYHGDGNMFCELSNKNAWDVSVINDATPQNNTRRLMAKSRAVSTPPDMVSENNGWKVTKFKTIPRKSNNWITLRLGAVHPVVGDLLFAYHDGDPTGKHDHVAIYMGVHEGNTYIAEGYSVDGNLINEKDKKVHLCKIEDSRMGLETDIITHFAHHISPEIKQKETPQEAPDIVNNSGGDDTVGTEYKGKWFTIKDIKGNDKYDTKGYSAEDIEYNIKQLIINVLDPLADIYNTNHSPNGKNKVAINSGYRNNSHNMEIKGEATSQHLAGQAADIYVAGANYKENLRLVKYIMENNIPYDQLIIEGVEYEAIKVVEPPDSEKKEEIVISRDENDFKPRWVHISFTPSGQKRPSGGTGNRKVILYASNIHKKDEKTGKYLIKGVGKAKSITAKEVQRIYNQILS